MIRCIYNSAWPKDKLDDGAPHGRGVKSTMARQTLGYFLDASLPLPLWADSEARDQRVENALNTMSHAERVFLEIEMQERMKQYHTSEYDPLR